jgi:hypothetical protein
VGKARSGASLLDRESSHMTLPLSLRNFHLLPYAHWSTQHHSKFSIALVILPYLLQTMCTAHQSFSHGVGFDCALCKFGLNSVNNRMLTCVLILIRFKW